MTLRNTGQNPYRLAPATAGALKHYVYVYADPRTDAPFYIGKGIGTRMLAHVSGHGHAETTQRIEAIRAAGHEPRIDILVHGIEDHETACKVEAGAIDLIGRENLTNKVRGQGSVKFGRRPLRELDMLYGAKPVEILHPVILIRINRLYRWDMTDDELYEATRGIWKMGERCRKAKFAFAVFQSVVREVYEIRSWHYGGETPYHTRPHDDVDDPSRVEFMGEIAAEEIRNRYVGRSVKNDFKEGAQNPISYVGF